MRYLIFIFLILSCQKRLEPIKEVVDPQADSSRNEYQLYSIEKAKISLIDSGLSPSQYLEGAMSPGFSILGQGHSYVEVLRCQEEYYSTVIGWISKPNLTPIQTLQNKKWAWIDSYGSSNCVVSSSSFYGKRFEDLSAPEGRFFYVINPCIDPEQAIDDKQSCSYDLAVTEVISVEDPVSQSYQRKLLDLKDLESRYNGLVSRLQGLNGRLLNEKAICEREASASLLGQDAKKTGYVAASLVGPLLVGALVLGGLTKKAGGLYKTYGDSYSAVRQLANFAENGKNPVKFTAAGLAALGAYGIIRSTSSSTTGQKNAKCAESERIAKIIIEIYEKKELDTLTEKIIQVSNEIHNLDKRFAAYKTSDFILIDPDTDGSGEDG